MLALALTTSAAMPTLAQQKDGQDNYDQPYSARVNDLRTWCDNIKAELESTLSETAGARGFPGDKAAYLIAEADRILKERLPLGAEITPHTLDALNAGLKFVRAVQNSAGTQTGVAARTKDKVVYRAISNVYQLAIDAYNDLDVPYYFSYVDQCYGRGCDDRFDMSDAYFDGLRDLSLKMLNLYLSDDEALANDYIELNAAKSAAQSAQFFLNASEYRRGFACQLKELSSIINKASAWSGSNSRKVTPKNPESTDSSTTIDINSRPLSATAMVSDVDPEFSDAGAVLETRRLVERVRNQIQAPACRYHRPYSRPYSSYR
jgi:hypothetical protein